MEFSLRPAGADDAGFLTDMVVAAAFWREDGPRGSIDDVFGNPDVAHYVTGWPLADDVGVVAEADRPVGAAWLRYFTPGDPGYGFVDAAIPELTLGVERSWRGRGVGRALLEEVVNTARQAGIPALSLSVEPDNYAFRLYTDIGFVLNRREGGAVTMTYDLQKER